MGGLGHALRGADTNQVSSSVGIVRVSAQAWRQGLRDFLFVLGLVSLALGLLNLLPVLPLDGGHIVMALVEKVRGRTFAQAVYVRYSVVGLSLSSCSCTSGCGTTSSAAAANLEPWPASAR